MSNTIAITGIRLTLISGTNTQVERFALQHPTMPAQAGIQQVNRATCIPTFAAMTTMVRANKNRMIRAASKQLMSPQSSLIRQSKWHG
jgi:hypothetical protein